MTATNDDDIEWPGQIPIHVRQALGAKHRRSGLSGASHLDPDSTEAKVLFHAKELFVPNNGCNCRRLGLLRPLGSHSIVMLLSEAVKGWGSEEKKR